jgi:adenine/guanine phosphoribosyltransferase-like PRPP-binding protein
LGYSGTLITESEFRAELIGKLHNCFGLYDYVTGPGRSGAIAAVYASHYLGIPFVPYRHKSHGTALIVDTAMQSGRTIRKAQRLYGNADAIVMFHEPPRVRFWYEELSRIRGKGKEYFD